MTFPVKLTELIEKAFRHEGERYADHTDDPLWAKKAAGDVVALTTYLVNHAEAIRDLVVAAENLNSGISLTRNEDKEKMWKLTVALAKLDES